jgi:hypothetical protein
MLSARSGTFLGVLCQGLELQMDGIILVNPERAAQMVIIVGFDGRL